MLPVRCGGRVSGNLPCFNALAALALTDRERASERCRVRGDCGSDYRHTGTGEYGLNRYRYCRLGLYLANPASSFAE